MLSVGVRWMLSIGVKIVECEVDVGVKIVECEVGCCLLV